MCAHMNYVCLGELQYLTINSLGEVSRRWIELGATTLKCRQKKYDLKKREILICGSFWDVRTQSCHGSYYVMS